MPKAAEHSTTSRRNMLIGGAALAMTAGLAAEAASPDAELIRRCEELIALDRHQQAILGTLHSFDDELRAEPQIDELAERTMMLAGAIEVLHPTTPAGVAAKARAAAQLVSRNLDGRVISRGIADDLAWSLIERIALNA